MTLASASSRTSFRVLGVDGDDDLARRLVDMGLWTGATVELLQAGPFGDPLLFLLHGYKLALRRGEADRVRVERVAAVQP